MYSFDGYTIFGSTAGRDFIYGVITPAGRILKDEEGKLCQFPTYAEAVTAMAMRVWEASS